MARTAEEFLLGSVRAIVEPGSLPGSIDHTLDLPLLLHLASRHHVRCPVLDALLADQAAAARAGARDGITLDDLKARRLAIAARNLRIVSNLRRMMALLERHGVKSALKPDPAVALLTSGVRAYELTRGELLIHPDDLEPARAAVTREGWRDTQIVIDATVPQPGLAAPEDLAAALSRTIAVDVEGGRLRVPAIEDQQAALAAEDATGQGRLDWLAAMTVLAGGRWDDARAARTIKNDEATEPAIGTIRPSAPRPARSTREVWIAGFPSRYGGADTELDHLIDLLLQHGVDVHIVPMIDPDPEMRADVVARGAQIHDYSADMFKDKVVVSFCNGLFLGHLEWIARAGRPARVVWFNCMTWLFDAEKMLHARRLIDVFGFQSQYQRDMLLPLLEPIAPVRSFPYRPYFHARRVEWRYRAWDGAYRVGRISRDDRGKFAPDTWQIFDGIRVPDGLHKAVHILGYGGNAEARIGRPPDGLDATLWAPGQVSATEFFRSIDTMIHKTGGSRESSSRVLFEAYAHGVVPIVERDFAFPEMVIHGETGYLAATSDEMSEYASALAADPREHRRLAENGRRHLEERLANPAACFAPWAALLDDVG